MTASYKPSSSNVDEINVGGEFLMLFAGHAAGDEDALVDGVDDRLTGGVNRRTINRLTSHQ